MRTAARRRMELSPSRDGLQSTERWRSSVANGASQRSFGTQRATVLRARETNLALDNIKAQIIKHYQRISDREAFVTAEMVRNAYQGIGGDYETLLKAFDHENEVLKKCVGKDRKLATYQSRVVARNYVAAFIKSFYKRSDMSMLELTPDFIKEFAVYLATEAGLRNGRCSGGRRNTNGSLWNCKPSTAWNCRTRKRNTKRKCHS